MDARSLIIKEFQRLLEKKSLDKISVKKICEESRVNRQTFYYHFDDILDLLCVVVKENLREDVMRGRNYDTWEHGFLSTLAFIKKHRNQFLNVYHSSYWEEANHRFTLASNKLLIGVVDECAYNMKVKLKENDKKFIVRFYRLVFNGIMTDWVVGGMKQEPEHVLRDLLRMISGSIPKAIQAFVDDNILDT